MRTEREAGVKGNDYQADFEWRTHEKINWLTQQQMCRG